MSRSAAVSPARFRKTTERSRAAPSANRVRTKRGVPVRYPDRGEDDEEAVLVPRTRAAWGDPGREFEAGQAVAGEDRQLLPRTSVCSPSIAEMPVSMNSAG